MSLQLYLDMITIDNFDGYQLVMVVDAYNIPFASSAPQPIQQIFPDVKDEPPL